VAEDGGQVVPPEMLRRLPDRHRSLFISVRFCPAYQRLVTDPSIGHKPSGEGATDDRSALVVLPREYGVQVVCCTHDRAECHCDVGSTTVVLSELLPPHGR
jgi:hypothetical protein